MLCVPETLMGEHFYFQIASSLFCLSQLAAGIQKNEFIVPILYTNISEKGIYSDFGQIQVCRCYSSAKPRAL